MFRHSILPSQFRTKYTTKGVAKLATPLNRLIIFKYYPWFLKDIKAQHIRSEVFDSYLKKINHQSP